MLPMDSPQDNCLLLHSFCKKTIFIKQKTPYLIAHAKHTNGKVHL